MSEEGEIYVTTGAATLREFSSEVRSLYTADVGPCVTLVRYDHDKAGMYHLWVDFTREQDAINDIRSVLEGANESSYIAIVGGMDRKKKKRDQNQIINSSEEAIALIKKEIGELGLPISYEDTMGMHRREIRTRDSGILEIKDGLQQGAGKYPTTVDITNVSQKRLTSTLTEPPTTGVHTDKPEPPIIGAELPPDKEPNLPS